MLFISYILRARLQWYFNVSLKIFRTAFELTMAQKKIGSCKLFNIKVISQIILSGFSERAMYITLISIRVTEMQNSTEILI